MTASAHRMPPLLYVESDIPAGLTLVEWRRRRCEPDVPRSSVITTVRRMRGLRR